jgi:hypothetical protein
MTRKAEVLRAMCRQTCPVKCADYFTGVFSKFRAFVVNGFDLAECFFARGGRVHRSYTPAKRGLLEFSSIDSGLSDNRLQGANPNCIVVWNWDGNGAERQFLLHHNVASAATRFLETMFCQNGTYFFPGKDS